MQEMNSRRTKTIAIVISAHIILFAGCNLNLNRKSTNSNTPSSTKLLTSVDGKFRISLPAGWVEDRTLHKNAPLQGADRSNKCFIIILPENKEDLSQVTIQKESELTRMNLIKSKTNVTVSEPATLTINGHTGLQYEIKATLDNVNLVYLHTIVETGKYYYQIVAWSLRSMYEDNRKKMMDIIQSFEEIN